MRHVHRILLVMATGSVLLGGPVRPVRADEAPTILKDSIRIVANSRDWFARGPKGDRDPASPSWLPEISFKVKGPTASGSRLMASFGLPTKKDWLHVDFDTPELRPDEIWESSCTASIFDAAANVNSVGMVDVTISIRNELLETKSTLFTGKFKVARAKSTVGDWDEFYVDQDWSIPIGYVFMAPWGSGSGGTRILKSTFGVRGHPGTIQAHLFFAGKEIKMDDTVPGIDSNFDPTQNNWNSFTSQFRGVYLTKVDEGSSEDPNYVMTDHPGDYEIKVLMGGHLARSIKFSVDAKGLVDTGIAAANKLGSDKIIVPVKVLGNAGPWNKLAWKTEALYGNPLAGFVAAE